jgi:hypothetical protein
LVELFDSDADGVNDRFAHDVEAVRSGYYFAHDARAYGKWRRDVDRLAGRKPAGKGLADLSAEFGGSVEVGGFEFRN